MSRETRRNDDAAAPVIIVGGGPVGMMLAMNLDRLGVGSIIVNTEPQPSWHPKGSTQNARTMEHYRRLGLAQKIRRLSLPADHPTDVGYFTRLTGWELARIPMPSIDAAMTAVRHAAATDQVPEPILRCNQMYVEAFVFAHLKTLAKVELRYGWRCVDWTEAADGVSVAIEHAELGRSAILRGAYLVGCDGGQSAIRRRLGIRYGGEKPRAQAYLGGTMVSSHLRVPDFFRTVPHRRCWHYFIVNADMRSNMVVLNGTDEFLVNSQLRTPDDRPDGAAIARRFAASMGRDIAVEWLGHWTWTAGQALVAERFGAGRVALAGDAVHLFTPTGGFGMNTGVDDAANLGWKLAALVQGWGGAKLLASYELERRPIALRNTGTARLYNRNVGDVPIGPAIEEDFAAGAAARLETGAFLAGFREEFASLGIQLGARYDGSPIIAGDGTAPPADDPFVYVSSACPGGRAPHLWFADRSSLFDHLGPGFTLLRLGGRGPDCAALSAAARARGVPFTLLDIDLPEARDLYARDLALIRPDHHVAWRGNALPNDCARLIAQVTGG